MEGSIASNARHCECSKAIQSRIRGTILDCFAALAMTVRVRSCLILGVIARLDRAIQYSETAVIDREAAAYWIPRLRGE